MEFILKKKVTGTRGTGETTPYLIATPTRGNIKLNEAACRKLGLAKADTVSIFRAETEEGEVLVLGVTNEGSKLGNAGAGLQFSDSAGWGNLEGSEDHNRFFKISEEGVEASEEAIKAGIAEKGEVFYTLEFATQKDKLKRGQGDDVESPDDEDEDND